MTTQLTWTPEEVKRRLEAGEPLSSSDRVWIDNSNMSIRSFVRVYVVPDALRAICNDRKVSYNEAWKLLRAEPVGRILYNI
jgi:hypothetical protein